MKNILWLTSWYPNRLAPFDGDFIQRHAQAVALLHKIEVLFVVNDLSGKITRHTKEEVYSNGNLTEIWCVDSLAPGRLLAGSTDSIVTFNIATRELKPLTYSSGSIPNQNLFTVL